MRRDPKRALAAVGVLAALVAGGCSRTDVATGSATPTDAVATFMHALGDKNSDAACAQVSTGGQALSDAGLTQCKDGLQKVIEALNDPTEIAKLKSATVTGATVNGDKATVARGQITNVPEGYQNDIDLVKINGRWYIDSKQ